MKNINAWKKHKPFTKPLSNRTNRFGNKCTHKQPLTLHLLISTWLGTSKKSMKAYVGVLLGYKTPSLLGIPNIGYDFFVLL